MTEGAAVAMYSPERNGWIVTWVSEGGLLGGTIGTFRRQGAIAFRDSVNQGTTPTSGGTAPYDAVD